MLRLDAGLAGRWRRTECESLSLSFPRHTFVSVFLTRRTDFTFYVVDVASDLLLVTYDACLDRATRSSIFDIRHFSSGLSTKCLQYVLRQSQVANCKGPIWRTRMRGSCEAKDGIIARCRVTVPGCGLWGRSVEQGPNHQPSRVFSCHDSSRP
jgi:hypothetical protein